MYSKVYVVTNPEYGWDCVVGVFSATEVSYEDVQNTFPKEERFAITKREVETNLADYNDY